MHSAVYALESVIKNELWDHIIIQLLNEKAQGPE